jgi:hypothetical protein
MFVRDVDTGRPLFDFEGRAPGGEKVAGRSGADEQHTYLARVASRWATGQRLAKDADERKFLLDLAPADVVTQTTRAEFDIPTGDYVADVVSQVKLVPNDRGYWYLESVTDALKIVAPLQSADSSPPEVNPTYAKTAFATQAYALAAKLPLEIVSNADWDVKLSATKYLVNALRLSREVRVAALLTTTANWAAGNQVTAISKWNGGSTTAAPLNDLFKALAASYLPANVVVLSENVAQYYYGNPAVGANITVMRDYVQSGGEMPRALFARAKQLTGGVPAYVWGPALPTNVPVIRTPDSIPTTVTFRWLGEGGPDGEAQDGFLVREYIDERDRSCYLVVAHNDTEVFVSNQVGALIVGALQ